MGKNQRNGVSNNMKVSGINNIVALSSIQVNRGHSEATKIAEMNGAITIGVSTKIEQSIHMKKEAIYPIIITVFEVNFALLNSPIIGSTKLRERINGIP